MIRSALARTLVAAFLAGGAAAPALAAAQTAQAKPAEAAPFVGDWTLALEGPNGPGTFDLSVKVENDKVVGEIANANSGAQKISDVAKTDKGLVLSYSFNYEGNPVDAVVSLTPAADGKVAAQIDFAGGAYVMTGAATKKDKAK